MKESLIVTEQHEEPRNQGQSEAYLTRTFDNWRAEFRTILEDHRRDIQSRLEKIEREIEKKSDKQNVDLLVMSLREDLRRHAEDIKAVSGQLHTKMGIETMWKVITLVLALGSAVGGVVGFLLHLLKEKL